MTTCQSCTRPSHVYLCPADDCWPALEADLALMGWLDAQLTVSRTRQARLDAGRRPAGDTALGYGIGAALAQDELRNTITTWARDLLGEQVAGTIGLLALQLRQPGLIVLHPAAGEIARDLEHVRKRGLAVINPQGDGMVFGVCGAELEDGSTCPAYLYADPDDPTADWVRCRACRTQHETRDRREQMRVRLEVLYLRAATLARVLPRLIDRPVSADLIRAWAAQGKPIKTQDDADGWRTYRCGDVITVALTTPQRERRMEGSAA